MIGTAMDWPLSREEKKNQLLRLYNDDVRAADSMLSSGNRTLEALRAELEAVRAAAGIQKSVRKIMDNQDLPGAPTKIADNEVERLRQAVEDAAAVLRAILPQEDSDPASCTAEAEATPPRFRARSEGAGREPSAVAARPALCRTPRDSRRPKRKVSFGGQPEEEPRRASSPDVWKEDVDDRAVILQTPPTRTRHTGDSPVSAKTRSVRSKTMSKPSLEEPSTSSRLKVHLTWLICSLVLVTLCGYGAFQMGSRRPPAPRSRMLGDKTCWKLGFTADFCCDRSKGPVGNINCWDADFTYARCCQQEGEL